MPRTVAWWKYNPILQKPTSLEPVKPWSWFWYYGPDPAAGVSYGMYRDQENGFNVITEADKVVYSPATGKPMELVDDIPTDELIDFMSKTTSSVKMSEASCSSCKIVLTSDFDLKKLDEFFCTKCGGEASATTEESKEKTMRSKKDKKEKVQAIKKRIRASILRKRRTEAMKKRKEELDEKRKATAKKRKLQESDELVSLDKIILAMNEVEEEEKEEAKMCKKKKGFEEEAMMEDEDLEEEEAMMEDEDLEEEDVEAAKTCRAEEDFEEDLEEEAMMEEEEELEEEAMMEDEEGEDEEGEEEGEEGEEEEEMVDLDMVLSMVRKRQRLAEKYRKAKAKKVRRIKAEEELEKIEETEEAFEPKEDIEMAEEAGPVEESMEALEAEKDIGEDLEEEAMMEVDEESTGEEKEEPDMVSEENPIADEEAENAEDMEAMKFEPLASLQSFKDINKEDVDMTLYGEESDNPTWNVTVAGIPAARIQLRNQTAADEIRAVFVSDDYARDLIVHCEKTGFLETMKKVNAELWANHTSNARIAKHFSTKAATQFEMERKKLLASYRQNYRNCINIVSAGLSKNFYPQAGNPLKDAMFTNLKTLGMPENSAISAIEKSFTESAAEYFNVLFDKAEEYMDMSPEARKEIAAAIASGSSLDHYVDNTIEDAEPASLAERVAQASVIPQANSSLKVQRDLSIDTERYKNELKSVWKS